MEPDVTQEFKKALEKEFQRFTEQDLEYDKGRSAILLLTIIIRYLAEY